MRSLSALLFIAFHVALLSECATSHKELIMLELEPMNRDDRIKRSSEDAGQRYVRQVQAIPPEYLNLLQQLAAQRSAAQHQQPQIEQLLVARDGSKEPAVARYILNPDGRIVQERLTHDAIQQQQYHQEQFVQAPRAPEPTAQPVLTPELEAFSRLQTQAQQDYHDAPIRAQIAGQTERPDLIGNGRVPLGGPGSASPQVYPEAARQALARHEARLREQTRNSAYAAQLQLQVDPGFYYQQFAQPQPAAPVSVASAETGRQLTPIYDNSQRAKVVYQAAQAQLQPQSQPQAQQPYTPKLPAAPTRRPIGASGHAQLAPSTQPQLLQSPESAQQQYLVETSRPSSQIRYVDPQPQAQDDIYASLFNAGGRGLFSPAITPKSLYSPRAGSKPGQESQLETVRIPTPANQRPLTRQELDSLVSAGYSITPVGNDESESYYKSKRAPAPLPSRNHVIYQNQQDGVSYQYSPGSSEYNPTNKAKRYAPRHDGILSYVVALQNQA